MAESTFHLRGDYIELNRLLKLEGLCASGGEGKQVVAEGRVKVDGRVELRKTCKVRHGQVVEYAGHRVYVTAQPAGG